MVLLMWFRIVVSVKLMIRNVIISRLISLKVCFEWVIVVFIIMKKLVKFMMMFNVVVLIS